MNEFDIKAAEWDNNPIHWDRSRAIVEEMIKRIPLIKEMTALEYGAGTGIASFLLKDYLKEITLMDNSSEMVRVISEKIKASGATNLRALNFDLENTDYSVEKFDLIFTQMVLHHVADIQNVLMRFSKLLNPGGYLAIADLYPEDGTFHGPDFTGHKGFNVEILSSQIRKQGFKNVSHQQCFIINKRISDTEIKPFPVFLIVAKRDTNHDKKQ
ncbi:MAG: class I SAM-dependent methyltransferase [Bacteroidia bacterium]|nr:class I SAM-dependent methyltransferase [Bacteroidia bacterium]